MKNYTLPSLRQILSRLRRKLRGAPPLALEWRRTAPTSWLTENLPGSWFQPPKLAQAIQIEDIAAQTQELGPQPLWQGYQAVYNRNPDLPWAGQAMMRTSDQVRSQPIMGAFFAWLTATRSAKTVVEVGTAFGISGMYWLAGLQSTGGCLVTFDPNDTWHKIAKANMERIGSNFAAVLGTVEAELVEQLGARSVDIAFIDAIHTSEFVETQLQLLLPFMARGGIIVVDDISFSADMADCWQRLSSDTRFLASVAVDRRVGLLELAA